MQRLYYHKVNGGRSKTSAKQTVAVAPPLAAVLDELRAEQRRIPNLVNRVFTKEGLPLSSNALRYAFENALAVAEVEDFRWHDFRHTAITRWAVAGLPWEVALVASGHKVPGMHGRYTNLQDGDILAAFQRILNTFKNENKVQAGIASK